MTNSEILTKAIEKAIKNGYKYGEDGFILKTIEDEILGLFYEKIIFDHKFAKAFWGKGRVTDKREKFRSTEECSKHEYPGDNKCRICKKYMKAYKEWFHIEDENNMYNFNEEFVTEDRHCGHWIDSSWKYHLMMLVTSKNRLQYIAQFLD